MSEVMRSIVAAIRGELAKHRNRPFLEAAMAVAAYVAMADGVVTFSERSRLDSILETLDSLRIYDPHDAVDLFDDLATELKEDPEAAHEAIFESIRAFAEQPAAAPLLVKIGLAVAHADGDFSPAERRRVLDLCKALDLEPGDFDL